MTLEELKSLKIGDIIEAETYEKGICLLYEIISFEKCFFSELDFCKTCPGSIKLKVLNKKNYIINGCRKRILDNSKIYHQNIEFITEEEFLV